MSLPDACSSVNCCHVTYIEGSPKTEQNATQFQAGLPTEVEQACHVANIASSLKVSIRAIQVYSGFTTSPVGLRASFSSGVVSLPCHLHSRHPEREHRGRGFSRLCSQLQQSHNTIPMTLDKPAMSPAQYILKCVLKASMRALRV